MGLCAVAFYALVPLGSAFLKSPCSSLWVNSILIKSITWKPSFENSTESEAAHVSSWDVLATAVWRACLSCSAQLSLFTFQFSSGFSPIIFWIEIDSLLRCSHFFFTEFFCVGIFLEERPETNRKDGSKGSAACMARKLSLCRWFSIFNRLGHFPDFPKHP